MSLPSNTTELQAILAQVNALPEAGSGGSVETCTVHLINDMPKDYIMDPPEMAVGVPNRDYAGGDPFEAFVQTYIEDEMSIDVPKGSVIFVFAVYEEDDGSHILWVPAEQTATGGCLEIGDGSFKVYPDLNTLYYIYGDCTITATAGE